MKKIIITGGLGFIGSALIRFLLKKNLTILNIDKHTYSGNLDNLNKFSKQKNYFLFKVDIRNKKKITKILLDFKPDFIFNLAAETHVDRSIDNPINFINTNIIGTYSLLEAIRKYWNSLSMFKKKNFRLLHVSTDEVFGDLKKKKTLFTENTPYDPSSPYSSSKASSDHLVSAWYKTYGLPTIITNCSNNYGPFQYPEKLIPLMILNALEKRNLPVYGKGNQIRDWLHVDDHVKALWLIINKGLPGEKYNIGGGNQKKNIEVVKMICSYLNKYKKIKVDNKNYSYSNLITFVKDRPGHDFKYAINFHKLKKMKWEPKYNFNKGLKLTVLWYIKNINWCKKFLKKNYIFKKRLGLNVR